MRVQTDLKDMVTYNIAVCPCGNCKVLSLNKPSLSLSLKKSKCQVADFKNRFFCLHKLDFWLSNVYQKVHEIQPKNNFATK